MDLALLPVRLTSAPAAMAAWPGLGMRDEPLAPISPRMAADMLARITGEYLTTQVFLDFGRLFRPGLPRREHHRIALSDLERHTRLLGASLERIAAAFDESGGDDRALFRMTGEGFLLVHTATCESVAALCRSAQRGTLPRQAAARA